MAPTIQDLAAELGVHKATVSRALSGKPGVSDDVRKRILHAAYEHGFYPNGTARSLATSVTETIALVFCDETSDFLTNPFYSKVLAGIAEETSRTGFSLAFCSFSLPVKGKRQVLPKIMRERRADGFLFVGDQDDTLIKYTRNLGYPLVLIDHLFGKNQFDAVSIDNVKGGKLAVKHLVELGHQRIGFIGGSLDSPSFAQRREGYRAGLVEAGLTEEPALIQVGDNHGGYEHMLKLLAMRRPPSAVFACNDVNAVKAVKAIQEMGFSVPHDVSIVGFDDSRRASETWPTLTTIRVDAEAMGRMGVEKLVARIQGNRNPPRQTLIDVKLVIRESTKPFKIDKQE